MTGADLAFLRSLAEACEARDGRDVRDAVRAVLTKHAAARPGNPAHVLRDLAEALAPTIKLLADLRRLEDA